MKKMEFSVCAATVFFLVAGIPSHAFDYEGHRVVNQVALASLPADFPGFVKDPANAERIAFLSGEADRWRNTKDLPLDHVNKPDHYLDLEDLEPYGMAPQSVSHFRNLFIGEMAVARSAHPEKFPAIDAARDLDHVRVFPGFLPWSITEDYAKLKSEFSYLKAFQELGTPEEVANAQANIVYVMGTMGHWVGDAAQPLHTTHHFNGWVGANPKGYTTKPTFHSWIDGGFLKKTGGIQVMQLNSKVRSARLLWPGDPKAKHDDVFPEAMGFIVEQHQLLEPLYQMEKEGKLSGIGDVKEGRAFLEGQILKAGQMLGDLWYSAWQQAPPDVFLKSRLTERKLAK